MPGKTQFPYSHLQPLALTNFLPPFLKLSLSLGLWACDTDIPFIPDHSTPCPVLNLYDNCHPQQTKVSLMSSEISMDIKINH